MPRQRHLPLFTPPSPDTGPSEWLDGETMKRVRRLGGGTATSDLREDREEKKSGALSRNHPKGISQGVTKGITAMTPRKVSPPWRLNASSENELRSGAEGIRTLDLCIANAALSQLSYRPKESHVRLS